MRILTLVAATLLAMGSAAQADDATLTIDGHVKQVLHLTPADLKALKPTEIDQTVGHDQASAHYTGVTLWQLVEQAGLPDEPGKGEHHLAHSVIVTGQDGYAVALSIGELDPDFEGKIVLIAYAKDGKPLPGVGLRLVVPGDHKGGRAVRDTVHITVD